jgi:hypothetical protein
LARKAPNFRIALVAFAGLLVLAPVAWAGKGGGGGHHTSGSCTRNAPTVLVDNNWAWSQSGSYGLPGQQLTYSIQVINNDVGCSSSSFAFSLSAPSGFSVSVPTSAISLSSGRGGYLSAYVTAPTTAADGDYPLTATATRSGTSTTSTSYYKVYSTDTTSPTVYWPNPGDGNVLSGRSYYFTASSNDDHAVKRMELYIDGAFVGSTSCADIAYDCQIYLNHSLTSGSHSATFKSYDWLGNVGSLTVNYTVS